MLHYGYIEKHLSDLVLSIVTAEPWLAEKSLLIEFEVG